MVLIRKKRVCEKCGRDYPNSFTLNGKRHILSSRKYCPNCSPLYGNNRKSLKRISNHTCQICGKNLSGNQLKYCSVGCKYKSLGKNYCQIVNNKYYENKIRAIEYLGGQCQKCGTKIEETICDFHHQIPSEKELGISKLLRKKWSVIKIELDKCDLLCRNCHMKLHYQVTPDTRINRHNKKYKLKAIVLNGGKCSKCGCDDPIVLCFHHPNNDKENILANLWRYKWETIMKELKKCILLCQNCHAKLHTLKKR